MPLFKKTDPTVVTSGRFGSWPRTTQAVYHVIIQLADYRSGVGRVKQETLAKLASVSVGSVARALERLGMEGIIVFGPDTGRARSYTYVFGAECGKGFCDPSSIEGSESSSIEGSESSSIEESDRGVEGSSGQVSSVSTEWGGDGYKKDPNKKDPNNNVWLPKAVYWQLVGQYGERAVEERVVLISNKDGKIKNKIGYLMRSLQGGWLPEVSKREAELEDVRVELASAESELEAVRADVDMSHFQGDGRWELREPPEERKAWIVGMLEARCEGWRGKILRIKAGGK